MAVTVTIWHNPHCSKSRETLALLHNEGLDPDIRLYLQDPPDPDELKDAARQLGLGPAGFIRAGDPLFRALGLNPEDDKATLISAMAAHPILIERPIVFANDKAALGRPPAAVLDII